jgi:hypothetical protein
MPPLSCSDCPLRSLPLFLEHSEEELALIQRMKQRELTLQADEVLIHEGQSNAQLFTLLSGWAFRCRAISSACSRRWPMPQPMASPPSQTLCCACSSGMPCGHCTGNLRRWVST